MKVFFLLVLALHTVLEGLVGLLLLFAPERVVPGVGLDAMPYLIYYGAAGVTMALAVAWFWPWRRHPVALTVVLGTLATFHSALTLAGLLVYSRGGGAHIMATHGIFALCFWILWLRRNRLAVS